MKLNGINKILEISDSYQAPQKMMDVFLKNDVGRDKIFFEMADLFGWDFSYDWFHEYFEDEHADRKNKKQDFTPKSISKLVSALLGSDKGVTYEPAAGTGGMLIVNWYNHRNSCNAFEYKPNDHLIVCHELSDKTIPFLLFNLSIRGISGVVFHGNSLTKALKTAYILTNKYNSPACFSDVTIWK